MLIIILIIVSIIVGLNYFYAVSIRSTNFVSDANNLSLNPQSQSMDSQFSEDAFNINDWKYVLSNKGVDVYTKVVPGTKLLAFKGISVLDIHISDILRPFANLTLSYQWIDLLKSIKAFDLHPSESNSRNDEEESVSEYFQRREEDIVHQYLALPWPISPRELLLHRTWIIDTNVKSVTFKYRSVNDHRVPLKEGVIRAISPHTVWKFTAVDKRPMICESEGINQENNSNESNSMNISNLNQVAAQVPTMSRILNAFRKLMSMLLSPIKYFFSNKSTKSPKLADSNIETKPSMTNSSRINSQNTRVEIECLVDSKGGLPAWFLNYMQRSFPPKSIEAFAKLARKELGRGQDFPLVATW
jgi:hypothetical protein